MELRCALKLPELFVGIIEKEIHKVMPDYDKEFVTLTFRDPTYSQESGGYHPVEIAVCGGDLLYVTDFAYFGPLGMGELKKELDFDFSQSVFQQAFVGCLPIESGASLFSMYQTNFCAYYSLGVYQVKVEEV